MWMYSAIAQSIINDMNEQELILLEENLQTDHRHFQEQILQAQQPIQNTQSNICWASIGLFITDTILLWFISQYSNEILNAYLT